MALYTEETAGKILDAIMDGCNVEQAATIAGIGERTVYKWAAGMGAPEQFGQQYARAMAIRADRMAEEIISISDHKGSDIKRDAAGLPVFDDAGNPVIDHDNIQRARLQVDTRKFLMGQWSGKYASKLNLGGQKENPIVTQTVGASDAELDARIAELLAKGAEAGTAGAVGGKEAEEGEE